MTDEIRLLLTYAAAALGGSFVLGFALRQVALKYRIVDTPGDRKIHDRPVPLLGGAAVLGGICVALCVNPYVAGGFLPLLLGAAGMLALNLADDIRGLSAKLRLAVEIALAIAVAAFGVRISFLPHGTVWTVLEGVITVVWLVGLANALNYLDGMDGLAAGSAAIYGIFFALILAWAGQYRLAALSAALAGACVGFLPHNFSRSKMFLGDAGSTFLGFLIAGIAVAGDWADDHTAKICVPLLILGVPIFDMILTTVTRVGSGRVRTPAEWLSCTGEDHIHHRLARAGLGRLGAVIAVWTVSVVLGAAALLLQ
jgi:UDP-GlcNAc:undecaprenyl-phosphate GlcNAc-1-phosphate transferase